MVQYVDLLSDTICSPITAPGYAGVSVIRISGQKSAEITKKLLKNLPVQLESHRAYFGTIKNKNKQNVDQVLVTFFEKGKSFTGDETVEVSCHGNPLIVNAIIDVYLKEGCRLAERGEFSFRAFYNGQIDLVQAESIHDLVTANSKISFDTSLRHLGGDLSNQFTKIEESLILAMSHLEATIDFIEQDINPGDYEEVSKRLVLIEENVNRLIASYDLGKNLKEGFKVLLLGQTNVGKSSLFNALFKEERAIVTDIAGTTRDLVTGQTFLGNNVVEFIDSAGIRETDSEIENIGIKKSLASIHSSDLILYVIDCAQGVDLEFIRTLDLKKTLFIINKIDIFKNSPELDVVVGVLESFVDKNAIFKVSALDSSGIEMLKDVTESHLAHSKGFDGQSMVTQARHFNHLTKVNECIVRSIDLLNSQESPDLISQELSFGLMEMNSLMGKEYDDEVLDKIFSSFCIGK